MSRKESISRIKGRLIEQLRGEDKDESIVALGLTLAALISMTCRSSATALLLVDEVSQQMRKFITDLMPGETRQ